MISTLYQTCFSIIIHIRWSKGNGQQPTCYSSWLEQSYKDLCMNTCVHTATMSFFRSGAGGKGEVSDKGGGKMVDNFKYKPGGNMPKKIWLGNSDPGDGFEGSSIV